MIQNLRARALLVLVTACALSCAGGQWQARAQVVGPEVRLLESPGSKQSEPDVLIDGDRVIVTFYGGGSLDQANVWTMSNDGGDSWSPDAEFPWYPGSTRSFDAGVPQIVRVRPGRYLELNNEGNGNYLTLQHGLLVGESIQWTRGEAPVPWANSIYCVPYDSPRLAHDEATGVTYLTYTRGLQLAVDVCNTRIELRRSLDEGLTWSEPIALNDPARAASQGAQPVVGPDGELFVVWRDFGTGDIRMRRSDDLGVTFSPETVVTDVRENQSAAPKWRGQRKHPIRWGDQHWMPDFPAVAVDRSDGPRRGSVYVAWSEGPDAPVPAASGTVFDSGANDLPDSAQPFELGNDIVGFVGGKAGGGGGGGDCDCFGFDGVAGQIVHLSGELTFVAPTPSGQGAGGQGFSFMFRDPADGTFITVAGQTMPIRSGYPLGGPIVITLPYTGRYVIVAACGVFYSLGYHLRTRLLSPAPGSLARDHRDLVMVSSADGGASWTPKRRLGDAPPGFDESLPALAVDEAGRLHAAWYDRRDGGPMGLGVDARWALSLDGGLSWLPSLKLNGASGTWLTDGGSRSNIGDRIALAAGGGRAHVVWVDGREERTTGDYELFTARIDLGTVGIAVSRFVAEGESEGVRVRWTVSDAHGVTGFRVHREGGGVVATVAEQGEREYDVLDAVAPAGEVSRYRLEVLRSASSEWLGPVEAMRIEPVRELAWSRVGPSPFSDRVTLTLALPREGSVSVRVYDLAGKEVARLHEGNLQAGSHAFTWGGESSGSGRAAAGVYLVRARSDEGEVVRRVIRVD